MDCFPCCGRNKDADGSRSKKEDPSLPEIPDPSSVQTFNFRELAMATKNFRQECLLGEGGFGRVFKGTIQASGQVVAVKQLDRNGMQENTEFTAEALKLSLLNHPNLVNLIGYCADGVQRLLVYEFMPLGSLKDQLFGDGPDKKPLDWNTRMKIASGAAQGLEYLHERANPSVIYGDFKPSNVLLDEDYQPKLADVGLSKLGAGEGTNQPTSRMIDTGYSAPEYSGGGEVTLKSDVYSFGVVLLAVITGRRAIDNTRPTDEQNLVTWAQSFFRDPKRFPEMADPQLNKHFPETGLNQAVGIAAMCLQDEPMVRPLISDVTAVLTCISMIPFEPPQVSAPPQQQMEYIKEVQQSTPGSQDKNSRESRSSSDSSSDSEDTVSGGATGGESAENTQSSQISDGESESSSDSESDGQSEDGSTDSSGPNSPENDDVWRERSSRKAKRKGVSSTKSPQRKNDSPRQIVVTFKEPSASSKYSTGRRSETDEESISESEGDRRDQSRGGSSSSDPKRQKRRGRSGSDVQSEHEDRSDTNNKEP